MGLTYKEAGVDISAGNEAVSRIKQEVQSTFGPEVLTGPGGFAGLFAPELGDYKEPVLVSGTDGVGTKLEIAMMMGEHQTIGIDLVAMCVNDILAVGARPLFFLDYLATGRLTPDLVVEIVRGISRGCKQAGCALIGGETAEMPGFYADDKYDLAGFAVGLADKSRLLNGEKIKPGDRIIGLPSSGLHSNGYSLVRKVLFDLAGLDINEQPPGLNVSLGEELLIPTRIYTNPVLSLVDKYPIRGIAHITGGGLLENIPRILPIGSRAVLYQGSWPVKDIFLLMERLGGIEPVEMLRTFNMGIGLVLIVPQELAGEITANLKDAGEESYLIGEIIEGEQGVEVE